jgi:hypothetical protein
MASNEAIERQPDERCAECGSGFAKDRLGRGFPRHLKKLRKKDKHGNPIPDGKGGFIMCGGTINSWGKGNRSF